MTASETPLTWVVGRGGLLGRHVEQRLGTAGRAWDAPAIPWSEPARARQVLEAGAEGFLGDACGGPWQVLWCAGAAVAGASPQDFADELAALESLLDGLGRRTAPGQGAFFLSSSCGGVYGGVNAPPYDEFSPVRALGGYGAAKLEAEQIVRTWGRASQTSVLIGRVSNLYGPGQNLAKPQGLISQICRGQIEGRPIQIWVSLDTIRDYLYAADAADLVIACMERLRQEQQEAGAPLTATKIVASQRAVTIGAVLGELRRIFRRPPRIILGASPLASEQARDLSLRSRVWPDIDERVLTTLPAGAHATLADLRTRLLVLGSQG